MNQRHMLPRADQELLARLAAHPDRAEAAQRRRLIEGEPGDFEANQARDAALLKLLKQSGGALDTVRLDRIIRACCWGTLFDDEVSAVPQPSQSDPQAPVARAAAQSAPRGVPAPTHPAPPPTAVQPAASQIARAVPPEPTTPQPATPRPAQPLSSPPPCTAMAVRFVNFELREGERPGCEVIAAGTKLGMTEKMLRTARERLGVIVERRGFGPNGRAHWRLPVPWAGLGVGVSKAPLQGEQNNRSVAPSTNDVRQSTAHVVRTTPEE